MSASPDVLNGRYRLDNVLGRGGFARVYLATDLRLKRQVAVKVLSQDLAEPGTERDFRARFEREAQAVAALDHPSILGIHDYGETTENVYLVMPYVAGGSLADRLRRTGHFPLEEAARYVRQVAAALDYAHAQGIVHRDLKPQNLLLAGSGDRLLLADFGIAKLLRESTSTYSQSKIVGTVAYMAPEQWRGQALPATDIYALGCLLFQLLTGRVPYGGNAEETMYGHMMEPIPSVVERSDGRVPTAVQAVIERALAKRVEGRFASASQLAAAFDSALQPRQGVAPAPVASPPGPPQQFAPPTVTGPPAAPQLTEPPRHRSRHLPMWLLIMLPILLLAFIATTLVILTNRDQGRENTPATTAVALASPTKSLPATSSAQPSVSAVPANASGVTTPTPPRSSSAGPPVSGTAMPTPTPTNTTSSIGGSTGTTSISGTFSFSGGLPLTSGEWEIVVFLAADLPGGTVTPLPSADVLTGLTPTWTTTVIMSGTQPFTYNVGGEWKGSSSEERAILVLRRKLSGATMITYPEQNAGLLTLHQNQQVTGYQLVFARSAP